MSGYYLVSNEDTDERWDDDTSNGDFGDAAWDPESALPSYLAGMPEWAESYSAGYRIEDAVRWSLGPDGESMSDAEAAEVLAETLAGMSSEDAENFLKTLGRIAQTALPVVGGAVGSIIAPGVGTALGSALGQAAGGLVGRATQGGGRSPQRPPAPRQPGVSSRRAPTATRSSTAAGGSAINALMGMLNNPQLLGAVANAAMGGRGNAPATATPFGAIMGALRGLAGEAAAEMHENYAVESDFQDSTENAEALVRIVGSIGSGASASAAGGLS